MNGSDLVENAGIMIDLGRLSSGNRRESRLLNRIVEPEYLDPRGSFKIRLHCIY